MYGMQAISLQPRVSKCTRTQTIVKVQGCMEGTSILKEYVKSACQCIQLQNGLKCLAGI